MSTIISSMPWALYVPFKTKESFRFDSEYEYDYEIRHFGRQLLASSRADVIKS